MITNNIPETALFVCSGGTSNVGLLTGQAGVEVVKLVGRGKADLVCLAGLMTQAPSVIEKANNARRIVTVDGCALNCARKIVEQAGYTPEVSLTLESDCGIPDAPSWAIPRKSCTGPSRLCCRPLIGIWNYSYNSAQAQMAW